MCACFRVLKLQLICALQHFHFMGSTKDVLNIHVYDKDLTKSESLGQVFLPLSVAASHQKGQGSTGSDGWTQKTMPLAGVKTGSIQIRVKWVPVYAFGLEIAEAMRTRASFNIKRLREIRPLLERSITMATPWRQDEAIIWKGACLRGGAIRADAVHTQCCCRVFACLIARV